MTKQFVQLQSPKLKATAKKKRFNRNFLDGLNERSDRILKDKQLKWSFDFETEVAISVLPVQSSMDQLLTSDLPNLGTD